MVEKAITWCHNQREFLLVYTSADESDQPSMTPLALHITATVWARWKALILERPGLDLVISAISPPLPMPIRDII